MKKIKIILNPHKHKELGFWIHECIVIDSWVYTQLDDITRIREVFKNEDYGIDLQTAWRLWNIHSNDLCACWLDLPETDKEIWNRLREYWKEDKK